MELLFKDIPVDKITTSMTINGPAPIVWAFYIANADNRGISRDQIGGTIQNDVLKEYIAQKSFIFPPAPSMRLTVDTFEFGFKEIPRWNTISISGYHIREAGSTAVQELAFTLADGFASKTSNKLFKCMHTPFVSLPLRPALPAACVTSCGSK